MKTGKRPVIIKFLLAVPLLATALALLAIVAFFTVRLWINQRSIPDSLKEPPREILRIIQASLAEQSATLRLPVQGHSMPTTETLKHALEEPNGHAVMHLLLNQDKPGARLYLQIKHEYDRLKDELGPFGTQKGIQYGAIDNLWHMESDDVSPEQAQWLEAHAALIGLIDQYCQTQGPGPVTFDEIRRYARQNVWNGRSSFQVLLLLEFSGSSSKFQELLAAAGRLSWQKGEYAQARRYYLDLFKHSMITPCFSKLQTASVGNTRLRQWIESGEPHIAEWKNDIQCLDEFKKQCLTREEYTRQLAESYAMAREDYMESIKRGFDPGEWEDSREDLYFFSDSPLRIPNNRYLYLMYVKASIPRWVRQMDKNWQQGLPLMKQPWDVVATHENTVMTTDIFSLNPYDEYGRKRTAFESSLESFLAIEAAFNLNRAALDLLFNPDSARKSQRLDLQNDPDHPWRDPFTGQPFRVIDNTSDTLIYSLGPDLRDQHGLDLRDKSQDTWGNRNYDISIRVPKPCTK